MHVPKVRKNHLSINKLCKNDLVNVLFDNSKVYGKNRRIDEELLIRGVNKGFYQIKLDKKQSPMVNLGERASLATWHARFGLSNERNTRESVNKFELLISKKKCGKM